MVRVPSRKDGDAIVLQCQERRQRNEADRDLDGGMKNLAYFGLFWLKSRLELGYFRLNFKKRQLLEFW